MADNSAFAAAEEGSALEKITPELAPGCDWLVQLAETTDDVIFSFSMWPERRCNYISNADRADVVTLLDFLFGDSRHPECVAACDMNEDDTLDIADALAIFGYLFSGGPGTHACILDPLSDCPAYPGCP